MERSAVLEDAFAHNTWAMLTLLDTCAALTPEQLETTVPGTFGSILATLRHTIGADSWYVVRVGGDAYGPPLTDEEEAALDLSAMRNLTERHGQAWTRILTRELDPEAMVVVRRDDGSETHAPKSARIAQVLHHGTDHRSQVCTALSALGVEPPEIDVWAWGIASGRIRDVPAPSGT
jgi:uncharacterized damage-inducible protein DinB